MSDIVIVWLLSPDLTTPNFVPESGKNGDNKVKTLIF